MDITQPQKIALDYIEKNIVPPEGDQYLIVDSAVKEVDIGWFFPFQTNRFIETNDIEYSVVGNWPILVTRNGIVHGPTRPEYYGT